MKNSKSINKLGVALGLAILICSHTTDGQAQTANPRSGLKNGAAAVAALRDLPATARAIGVSPEKLEKMFATDRTLHADPQGRLLHIEPNLEAAADPALGGSVATTDAVIPPENAFLLNSKPGSEKTIYLDFDGAVLTGTAWNSTLGIDPYNAAAFDVDGVPASFNIDERNRIIGMWRQVSEDFAAFDVNVTTQDPGKDAISRTTLTDTKFGTVVLITKWFNVCTSCGGVAYYGAFGDSSDFTKPALAFLDKLGGGNEKYTAECISHEVGHNLNLMHDGALNADGTTTTYYAGHGDWAPIMGNSYYKNITHWSRGEYPGANNNQDDYAAMLNRGLLPRSDDHGNTAGTATLVSQGVTFAITGIIERTTDVDFFGFIAGVGQVTIDILPVKVSPNLDVKITVTDSSGKILAEANPTPALGATITFSSPGDNVYYARVDGVGAGDLTTGYLDYGSLGQYTLIGTVSVSGNQAPLAVAAASVFSGLAPLAVTFDGSGSTDADGTISSYSWSFSDGWSATGAIVQRTLASGTYVATLTVTDNGGLMDSDTITVTVTNPPNQPPTAAASASTTTGTTPTAIRFSSAGSTDPNGSIVSYKWTFGDGGTSTQTNPTYTYNVGGTFNAVLMVTDNDGATASSIVGISITQDPAFVPAPSNLVGTVSGTSVTMSWTDNSTNETGFRVYRRTVTTSGKGANRAEIGRAHV